MSGSSESARRGPAPKPNLDKTVGVVDRAAAVLECFSPERPSLTLAELAVCLSLPKPTVFRIASVLTKVDLLDQNPITGAYSLGFANLRYADQLLSSIHIRNAARPVMESLRNELNETIVLSQREGDFRYNIDSVESTHAIGQTQQIGAPIPLYAGAASRVMLAALSAPELDDYLSRAELTSFSPTTITDPDELRAEVERTRKRGFVITTSEFTLRSHAVACAIDAAPERELAAIHVSIPHARHTKALERRAVVALQAGVGRIMDALAGARGGN